MTDASSANGPAATDLATVAALRPSLALPTIAESLLTEALVRTLPVDQSPPAWTVACSGLMWLGRGGDAASGALAPGLRGEKAVATAGGFVRYADTPVGVYDEVLGGVVCGRGRNTWLNVAFMAVDSPTSLVGGREHWAMPKTLATFDGAPTRGSEIAAASADGLPWRVSAKPRAIGPAITVKSKGTCRQQFADGRVGTSKLEMKGTMRPALVNVEVTSAADLGTWLTSGRHVGVFLENVAFTLGETSFD